MLTGYLLSSRTRAVSPGSEAEEIELPHKGPEASLAEIFPRSNNHYYYVV